jgi:hypothetical protein
MGPGACFYGNSLKATYYSIVPMVSNSYQAIIPANSLDFSQDREIEDEQAAFMNLLKAMYNMPFSIKSLSRLGNLTRLADFYRALPVVSMSLYRVNQGNALLADGIFRDPFKALPSAKKLRHPVSFREALIHAIGEHETWETLGNETPFPGDEQLNYTVLRAHSQFAS